MAMFHRITLCMFLICALEFSQTDELPGPGTLRSLNKRVTSSSQHPEAKFNVSHAVDGSTSRDSAQCNCCAATIQENDPWIQIDLGRLYRVAKVEIIGRTDYVDSFNMAIFVSTKNTSWQGSTATQPTLPDEPEQYHNITFSYPVIGQFVTLQLRGFVLLCVCEVNIYSKDCSNGSYGLFCNETCGQCQDGETCDHVTGRCTRCRTGYELPSCTKECLPGTFGPNCSYLCHCKDNTTCDHVNGSCPDNTCDAGWQGSNCSLECEPGTFGQNCSSLCHCYENQACNHMTGRCPGDQCEVRWEGANCSLSTLRSRNAKVTGSSQYIATNSDTERFNLSHAVDGSTSMDPIGCSCCATTASGNQPWIQIDLGRLYRVSIIDVIGRLNASKPFVGMHIYIHTQQNNWTNTNNLQLTIPNVTEKIFISVFKYPVIGQYVTLQLPDDNVILLVCEVSIYSNGCTAGRFGANCSFLCHCLDNQVCDPATGGCPEGKCASGWEGTTCSNTLISLNANVSASSIHTHSKFALARAVDGNTRADSDNCACCAATNNEDEPWIQIDLGRLYRVAKVEVVSRTDWASITYFAGMRIYLHENRDNWIVNHALVRTVPNDGSRYYNTTFDNPVIAQYVTLQIPVNDNVLLVCEVSIFSSYCSYGTYGLYCNETCGQCQNGETCDNVTGNCAQCLPGYQSPICTKACLPGSFGPNCSSTCHCQGNGTCDHVNGSCPDGLCDLGWRGSSCSQDCSTGTYGLNCKETCGQCQKEETCDYVTGNCAHCLPGYQYPLCKKECLPGSFGSNCSSTCHCQGNGTCDHVNGSCPNGVCELGWRGSNCSQECPAGTYGLKCHQTCGQCQDNQTCNQVTGNCAQCAPGYQFPLCKENCSPSFYGPFCNKSCGQCQEEETCDPVTGSCKRCSPGYQSPSCIDKCAPGRFGLDCASGCNCHKNQTCHHVTGECPDHICDVGWIGLNCSTECDHMTYGNNCAEECGNCYKESCDRQTGECSPCFDGYTGPRCMEGIIRLNAAAGMQVSMSSVHAGMDATKAIDGQLVDDPETCGCCSETTNEYSSWWQVDLGRPFFLKKVILYGRLNENVFRQLVGFSILTSSINEFPDNPVHNQNGEIQDSKVVVLLPGVAARYVRIQRLGILTICEVELVQSDIICPTYTYGRDCTPCGACRNGSCDTVTGDCPSGCYDGYEGNMCEKLTVHKSTDNDVINGVIGAGVGVVTSLLVVALIVALFRYKRRRTRIYEEPSVIWAKEPAKESAYATLENQEIVIEKEETYDNPI